MAKTLSINQALITATQQLNGSSPSARIDAESLLCHLLNCNTAHLAAWPEQSLGSERTQQFNYLLEKRKSGIPVAYLTGIREFWSLPFNVTPATLIPRPETETLVEFVLNKFGNQKNLSLVDLGTGCGAIAIALGHEKPGWVITATDISDEALAVAKKNAKELRVTNIHFVKSNWFENLKDTTFDVIVSNPPYIANNDTHLTQGDVCFEPDHALKAGKQGMDDIQAITAQAKIHLYDRGWLVFEHGFDQKESCRVCLLDAGFNNIEQKNDLSGQPRMSAGH